ncbi:hypothetical protein COV12_03095 [Candidatus Woesearchaeota archaeon CG10_big_fil_rev_8_21_14_0_10_32_24]|nr:MAG: hypothetical protein COV12_03095 [Candidatus Woesearchaeota archaeon CG10_big_fil_rev_8_21_14_0_10_32_24]
MLTEILTVIIGFVLIIIIAELILRNSIQVASHYGLSGTFIGLTVLSIGTSLPEIMTHIIGSVHIIKNPLTINTFSALLLGTNIGSDVFQQNLILPVIRLLGGLIIIRKNLFPQMGGLILASILVWIFTFNHYISRLEAFILLVAYIVYLIYIKKSKISESFETKNHLTNKQVVLAIGIISICFIIMAVIADEVLNASTIIIQSLNISASFFGVIALGIASALPELTTSLIAVLKKKEDISAGILIGSNITNPLLGIGLGALISTYTVPNVVIFYDLPVKIGTAALIYYFLFTNEKLKRWESIMLITLFFTYLYVRTIYFPTDFI